MDAAPKPAEPRKMEPARNASLFDIGPAPAAPLPTSDADEEEEILAEIGEEDQDKDEDPLDDAA